MSRLYLYRLYRHSRTGFIVVMLFIAYIFFMFYKKMDTVFSPYNNMFSTDFTQNNLSRAYMLKINGAPLPITKYWYWKKDFLESSMTSFAAYLRNGKKVYLNFLLEQKITDPKKREEWEALLTPGRVSELDWFSWYANFAGRNIQKGDKVELIEYSVFIESAKARVGDSSVLFSQIHQ